MSFTPLLICHCVYARACVCVCVSRVSVSVCAHSRITQMNHAALETSHSKLEILLLTCTINGMNINAKVHMSDREQGGLSLERNHPNIFSSLKRQKPGVPTCVKMGQHMTVPEIQK